MALTAQIVERRKVIRCIRVRDDVMVLIRKLDDGKVWLGTYQWWKDAEEGKFMVESWQGIDILRDDLQPFHPDTSSIAMFEHERAFVNHLWRLFGNYNFDPKLQEW